MKTLALIGNNSLATIGLRKMVDEIFEDVTILHTTSTQSFIEQNHSIQPAYVILILDPTYAQDHLQEMLLTRETFSDSAILIVYNEIDLEVLRAYLKTEAQGYVSLWLDASEIQECLTSFKVGRRYLSQEILNYFVNELSDRQTVSKAPRGEKNALTLNELKIAKFLAAGVRPGQIAKKLDRKMSTISTIKKNIFKKMKVDNIVDLNQTIASL
jgi:DNA-binding NarL/FixJ family response regulator